jgi:hypothetical protein
MKTPYTTLIIKYPSGAQQIVKPNLQFFQGDWTKLAQSIAGRYFPEQNVNFEVK